MKDVKIPDGRDWDCVWLFAGQPYECDDKSVRADHTFSCSDVRSVEAYKEGSVNNDSWQVLGQLHDDWWFFIEASYSPNVSGMNWSGKCFVASSRGHIVRYGMGDDARGRLGISLDLPVSDKIRNAAAHVGVDPNDLACMMDERRAYTTRSLAGVACQLTNLGHDYVTYWETYGDEQRIADPLEAAATAPMPDEAVEYITAALLREPTKEELETFLVIYRIRLLLDAPRRWRFKCLCGHWRWGHIRIRCDVCGRTLCDACAEHPVPFDQNVVVCTECVGRIPTAWRELLA